MFLCSIAAAHVPFGRGETVITELHAGPADAGGQWFEVRNATTNGLNLIEQVYTDADGDSFAVSLTVIIRDGESAVFAAADSTVDADYHFPAAFDLRPDAGRITHTDLTGVVDEVVWDTSWGADLQLDLAVVENEWANDLPTNWCAEPATPGMENLHCPGSDVDDDGDGWTEQGGDCDDTDATVNPDASDGPEPANDGDCDGVRDDEPAETTDTGTGTGTGTDTGSDTGSDTGADTSADTDETGDPTDTAVAPHSFERDPPGPARTQERVCGGAWVLLLLGAAPWRRKIRR